MLPGPNIPNLHKFHQIYTRKDKSARKRRKNIRSEILGSKSYLGNFRDVPAQSRSLSRATIHVSVRKFEDAFHLHDSENYENFKEICILLGR